MCSNSGDVWSFPLLSSLGLRPNGDLAILSPPASAELQEEEKMHPTPVG